jgi:drug/metabolite transporter (DMT)-like permease
MGSTRRKLGIQAALTSAIFLGFAPIFGKQAILFGFSPLAVVTFRTGIAMFLLLVIMLIFQRKFFYIYPVGLAGCFLAGFVNGVGSILYYTSLTRLDASVGHLLYSFYPLFVAVWLTLDKQPINAVTTIRLLLAVPGMYLLISAANHTIDLVGVIFMLSSAVLYALHLIIIQRILYEVPSPTVTLYTLLSMSITVLIPYLIFNYSLPNSSTPWWPIMGMAFVTFFSRLTLFMGVKYVGGMQTALLGLGELLITVFLAILWLGESLSFLQWVGAALLISSLLLIGLDKHQPERRHSTGWLSWLNTPDYKNINLPWQ